jgi:hypothetical protein
LAAAIEMHEAAMSHACVLIPEPASLGLDVQQGRLTYSGFEIWTRQAVSLEAWNAVAVRSAAWRPYSVQEEVWI